MNWPAAAFLVLPLAGVASTNTATPALPETDRVRIAEAFRLADAVGNRVWPDWDKAPFAVLLVTPDREFLIRHPSPSKDFTLAGEDTMLESKVWHRPRIFPPNLLATFPAVGGVNTIVIGQAENTAAKTSTPWVVTLLHEHFHQLQESPTGYYAAVNALGLSRGDSTGMWMLNYAFPYENGEVNAAFTSMSRALAEALAARNEPAFDDKLEAYLESRRKFRDLLAADDYRYFAFQIWKEGIARYTELHIADRAAAGYTPSRSFQRLKDYRTFEDVARDLMTRIEKDLVSVRLDQAGRTVVYNHGAAEGLVLDRVRPEWRKRYFEERFSLDRHFPPGK